MASLTLLYKWGDQWHMVEYKTDYVRDVDALHALLLDTDYVDQMRRYMEAVEHLYGRASAP